MKPRSHPPLAALLLLGAWVGCATPSAPVSESDPLQSANRPIFAFNLKVDDWILRPVARGWTFVTPEGVRIAFDKFFTNLAFPVRFVTNLGQGEVVHSGSEVGRFLLNTTVGIAGFFDPASHLGMQRYDEDFGQMFGRWRIASGPYWVLPLIGPSNPRDTVGWVFDTALNLRTWLFPYFTGSTVYLVNERALADQQIQASREAAFDYYIFVRDAYLQRRRAQILDRGEVELEPALESDATEDLYELDEDFYETDDDFYDVEEDAYETDGESMREERNRPGQDGEEAADEAP
jgi:phospholipid-binding lipoprotein MlaA